MRKVYILPNLFTAGSLFCGVLAMYETFDGGDLILAINYIFLAAVLDVFDGFVARLTRTQSAFGMNLDSLADVVSFGVAPAFMVYASLDLDKPLIARAACGLFTVCGALRLARFNVQAAREEKKSFLGMPIPAAACGTLSLLWVLNDPEGIAYYLPPAKVLPLFMVLIAYVMVSRFPYVGLKSLRVTGRYSFEILVSIVIILAILIALREHIELILFGLFIPYLLSGPVYFVLQSKRAAQSALGKQASEDSDPFSLRSKPRS